MCRKYALSPYTNDGAAPLYRSFAGRGNVSERQLRFCKSRFVLANFHLHFYIHAAGIYEALLDQRLNALLTTNPFKLRYVLAKVDPEEEPSRYAAFVGAVLAKAFNPNPIQPFGARFAISSLRAFGNSVSSFLTDASLRMTSLLRSHPLTALTPMPRPETRSRSAASLPDLPRIPPLVHELQEEIRSAHRVNCSLV